MKKNNYDKMVQLNRMKQEDMLNKTLSLISEMLENDEQVTVASLSRQTGRSRDYFYKNKAVREAIEKAQALQTGKTFTNKKEEILNKSLIRENELLRKKICSLKAEIDALNDKLSKQSSLEFDYVHQL